MSMNNPCLLPRNRQGHFRSLILTGIAGGGKTSVAQELIPDAKVVRIPMATRTYETFGTYPFPKVDGDSVSIEAPVCEKSIEPLFDRNIGDEYGILVLDDVTTGDERLQSAILDIIQFHSIGEEKLGKNVLIVLTGNRSDDGCYAIEWSKAVLSRCMVIEHTASLPKWIAHKDNADCDPLIIAFLHDHKGHFAPELSDDDSDNFIDDLGMMASPRDWSELGNAVNDWGGWSKFKANCLYNNAHEFSKASIGAKSANELSAYASIYGSFPTVNEVFDEPSSWSNQADLSKITNGIVFSFTKGIKDILKARSDDKGNDIKKLCLKSFEAVIVIGESMESENEYLHFFVNSVLNDAVMMKNMKLSTEFCNLIMTEMGTRYPKLMDMIKARKELLEEASLMVA